MESAIQVIERVFNSRGANQYGSEAVTQLEHALQCAQLAEEAKATSALIAAALLHDIGHILDNESGEAKGAENLDDKHEFRGNGWVRQHFGNDVADPVRLHVLAKRYLCTVDEDYQQALSPTSLQSFFDQGGLMTSEEIEQFESEPFYQDAVTLRRWDDLAKDPDRTTPPLSEFLPQVTEAMTS